MGTRGLGAAGAAAPTGSHGHSGNAIRLASASNKGAIRTSSNTSSSGRKVWRGEGRYEGKEGGVEGRREVWREGGRCEGQEVGVEGRREV